MINWQSVLFNSFWIFGLSLLLAAASYAIWSASESGRSMRDQFSSPGFLRFFWASSFLVAIGLAGTSGQTWETLLWAGMALFALVAAIKVAVQPAA
ncbi:MAG: hypothetical protein ACK2UK_06980 [Candidatus Promineifilaceae bacterium]